MRRKRQRLRPLSGLWSDYRLAQELRAVSKILDDNPSILELVLHDLCDTGSSGQGAPGRLGRAPGTGAGPQDSSRCHRGGKSHPLSDRFLVAVRRDSGPHSNPSPVVPALQDRLP